MMDEQERRETTEAEKQYAEAEKQYSEAGKKHNEAEKLYAEAERQHNEAGDQYTDATEAAKQAGVKRREEAEQRHSDRATIISDSVVQKIAGIAAQEVEKVQMGGGTAAAVTGFLGSVSSTVTGSSGGGSPTSGVSVEVGQEEAAVDLTVAVEYGVSIPRTTQTIRDNVINRVENLTGLRVTEVNIVVNDVQFPEERPQLGEQQEVEQQAQEQEQRA